MKFLFILSITLFANIQAIAGDTMSISAEQLVSIQQAEKKPRYLILDVRTGEEYSQGHIPGAVNIPHNEISQRLNELSAFKHDMVIVHCRSGRRAKIAEKILLEQGFSSLKHLEGDYIGWQEKQFPIVNQ